MMVWERPRAAKLCSRKDRVAFFKSANRRHECKSNEKNDRAFGWLLLLFKAAAGTALRLTYAAVPLPRRSTMRRRLTSSSRSLVPWWRQRPEDFPPSGCKRLAEGTSSGSTLPSCLMSSLFIAHLTDRKFLRTWFDGYMRLVIEGSFFFCHCKSRAFVKYDSFFIYSVLVINAIGPYQGCMRVRHETW
jgi:hypothetical protein